MKKSIISLLPLTFGLFIFSLILDATLTCAVAQPAIETKKAVVYLSDMKSLSPEAASYFMDKNKEGLHLMINGEEFKKGISINTNSALIFEIEGKYSTLKVVVGHDDAYLEYKGKLTFIIQGDGKKIYESKPLSAKQKEEISVDVTGVRKLHLIVNDDGLHSPFAVWANASLY